MHSDILVCPECRMQFAVEVSGAASVGENTISCPKCAYLAEFSSFKCLFFCPECGLFSVVSQNSDELCSHCRRPVNADPVNSNSEEYRYLLNDGIIFEKYRIIKQLGHGGMSEVYQAEHILLGRIYALKVMRPVSGKDSIEYSKRFLREAQCFLELEHPNIIRVYDSGCDPVTGYLFIAMEYLAAGSLADKPAGKMSETELLKIASDMAEALAELEKHNIVHRDIKPGNIMLGNDGNYKLMDLGIAKKVDLSDNGFTLTLDLSVLGTPAYASPEQCQSPHNTDIRSDIYSLGATLYHLACGELPFGGDTPVETVVNVIHNEPGNLRKKTNHLSRAMLKLIGCMMEKSPFARPQNADILREMIHDVARKKRFIPQREPHSRTYWICVAVLLLIISVASLCIGRQIAIKKERIAAAAARKMKKQAEEAAWQVKYNPVPRKVPEKNTLPVKTVPAATVSRKKCTFRPVSGVTIRKKLVAFQELHPYDPENNDWKKPPVDSWEVNFNHALERAEKEGKFLLILAGSSKNIQRFFMSEDFEKQIKKDFILCFLDCERDGMPLAQRRHIVAVRQLFAIMQYCPSTVIIAPGTKHISTIQAVKNHQDTKYKLFLSAVRSGEPVHFDQNFNLLGDHKH